MKVILLAMTVGTVMALFSCSGSGGEDRKFEDLANRYVQQFLKQNPEWATWLGDHRFDHLMNDYSLDGITADLNLYRAYIDSLGKIDTSRLNMSNRIDYEILLNGLKYSIFRLDTLKSYEWNTGMYNPGGAIYGILQYEYAPLRERLINIKGRLEAIPEILENARINVKNPPKVFTETAILQNGGTISMIRDDLISYLNQVPELKEEMEPVQAEAVRALEEYGKWLEEDLLPRSNGDFRLGEEKYRAKLHYALDSDISKEELLARAEAELAATQEEMFEIALPLFKKYFPEEMLDATITNKQKIVKMVLDRMADDHPNADNVIAMAKEKLRECEDFVRDKKLVSLPDKPIEVSVMPEFQRGFAIAYCVSPGPLEKNGKTFYWISPPPENWDEKRAESYFREYNNYMLSDLTIHEAMPGHYLQFAHANNYKSPTLVRALFGSGTFTEGWATYTEQLMVDHGFGGPELKLQMLKMRLRMLINVIIDQKIHTEGMTEDEAMALMMNEGYQEEGEAAGKWRRACMSSTQLSTYYMGNIEINDIRKACEAKSGGNFNLMEFHDQLLSYGTPAPKYVKKLLEI